MTKGPLAIPAGRSAALFVDLQEEHRKDKRLLAVGYERVIANAARLQAAARENAIPLFHFAYVVDLAAEARPFHPRLPDGRSAFSDKDDPLTAICPEAAPQEGEELIVKSAASAFNADFAERLRRRGVEWVHVAGVWTEACVDATVKDALRHGFRVVLVKDGCASGSVAMHQTGILNLANRLYGGAVVDTDKACRLMAGERVEAWSPDRPVPIRYEADEIAVLYGAL